MIIGPADCGEITRCTAVPNGHGSIAGGVAPQAAPVSIAILAYGARRVLCFRAMPLAQLNRPAGAPVLTLRGRHSQRTVLPRLVSGDNLALNSGFRPDAG